MKRGRREICIFHHQLKACGRLAARQCLRELRMRFLTNQRFGPHFPRRHCCRAGCVTDGNPSRVARKKRPALWWQGSKPPHLPLLTRDDPVLNQSSFHLILQRAASVRTKPTKPSNADYKSAFMQAEADHERPEFAYVYIYIYAARPSASVFTMTPT